MIFEVIPDQQTPLTPEIKDVSVFINENTDKIEAFKKYAEFREDGIGLAANQCSLDGERFNLRMVAVKDIDTHETRIAIDPKIVRYYGMKRQKLEGCLTWKNKTIVASRNMFVDVEFYTPDGISHQETHRGFQAQVWQHELNHINGVEEDIRIRDEFINLETVEKIGRNDLCPCGSKLKYKRCCIE